VEAIFENGVLPTEWKHYTEINAAYFTK
jgi:hypothetical protein